MPKIILRSNYLNKKPQEQLKNFINYVATREGVEIPKAERNSSATRKQKLIIEEMLGKFPDTIRMDEYENYKELQTKENALELINAVIEENFSSFDKIENYIGYIAKRPRAEKENGHGLFSDAGEPIILEKVAAEIANHKGTIWTDVISLKREDAERLGYDSAERWRELLRSKRAELANLMQIKNKNFKWYAAFHNEAHHPHVHLVMYSADPIEGWLTKRAIEEKRSMFAHAIFRQDFYQMYEKQNMSREELKMQAENRLKTIMELMKANAGENQKIERLMKELSDELKHTKGKKQYGYLTVRLRKK